MSSLAVLRSAARRWLPALIPALPALFTGCGNAPPAATHEERLLVCNKADQSLSIFDPTTRVELAVLTTGAGPHEVAVSPDGRTAVVSDYGAQKPGSTLTVVDLQKNEVRRTIELAFTDPAAGGGGGDAAKQKLLLRPHGLAFVGDDHLVVTGEIAHRLALVRLSTGAIERTWATPQVSMHMVALSPDQRLAHATSIQDGDVATFALVEPGTKATSVVPTGKGAEGLAVNPGTGEVWVGNRAANTVTVVDPKTGTAGEPIATADFPFRIAFTKDGKHALVSCAEGGDVQVFDAATKTLVRSISIAADGSELSAMPMGICVDPEGKRAYVACGRGEFIAVLDLAEGKLVHKLRGRPGLDGIAFVRVPISR